MVKAIPNTPLGIHVILDLYECNPKILNDKERIEEILVNAAETANATILDKRFHEFSPQGVTGIIVISESHITIHTWPEHFYASVDIYTCGNSADPLKAAKYIIKELECKKPIMMKIDRGIVFGDLGSIS